MFGKSRAEIADAYQHFGALADAGFSLEDALDFYLHTRDRRQKRQARILIREVRKGSTFHAALKRAGLPALDTAFMRAAEDTGHFSDAARKLADHYLKEHQIRHAIQMDCLEPGLTFLGALFLAPIPKYANGLISGGDYLFQAFGSIFLVGFGLYLALRLDTLARHSRLAGGLRFRLLSRLPIAGRILRAAAYDRFFTCLVFYVSSGHTGDVALEAAGDVAGSPALRRAARLAARRLGKLGLPEALAATGAFRPDQVQLIRTGVEAGKLEGVLERICADLRYETDLALGGFRFWFPKLIYALSATFAIWRMYF